MTDAWGGSRVQAKPPERGVFPLDHDGECKAHMKDFLACLRQSNSDHFPCRHLSAKYLECRMEKELMAKDDLNNIGLGETGTYVRVQKEPGEKEKAGFIAGTAVRPSKKRGLFW